MRCLKRLMLGPTKVFIAAAGPSHAGYSMLTNVTQMSCIHGSSADRDRVSATPVVARMLEWYNSGAVTDKIAATRHLSFIAFFVQRLEPARVGFGNIAAELESNNSATVEKAVTELRIICGKLNNQRVVGLTDTRAKRLLPVYFGCGKLTCHQHLAVAQCAAVCTHQITERLSALFHHGRHGKDWSGQP